MRLVNIVLGRRKDKNLNQGELGPNCWVDK